MSTTLTYIENGFSKRVWTDKEQCVTDLLVPYQEPNMGDLEYMREEIHHMRECLARYIVHKGIDMDDLSVVFYADIDMKEVPDE